MSDAIVFDREKVQRLDDIGDRPRRLSGSKLLWVDVDRDSEESADRVAEAFGLDRDTRDCLASSKDRAIFHDRGRYIHVTTYAPDEDDEGELSMNFKVGLFEEPILFWVMVAMSAAIAPLTIGLAKQRKWI